MSEELNTAELEAENLEQKETVNQDAQTVEDGQTGNDVKEEESPYQKQLDELNKKLETKDDIIEKKNRAIEAEKSKRREAEEQLKNAKPTEVEELKQQIEKLTKSIETITVSKLDEKIAKLTNDPVKQQVIKKHYEQSIVHTGDESVDLRRALAIADENIVLDYHTNRAIEENNETFLSTLPKSNARGSKVGITQDRVKLEAARILKEAGQDAAAERLLKL